MRTRTMILAGLAVAAGMLAVPTASAAEQLAIADGDRLQLVNTDGSRARTLAKVRSATEEIDDVAASRDGKHVAYVVRSPEARRSGLFVVRRNGRDQERLATGEAVDPDFSRDDEEIAASVNGDVWLFDTDGRGQQRVLRESRLSSVKEIEVARGGRIALIGKRADSRFRLFSVRSSGRDLRRLADNVLISPLSVPRDTGAPVVFTRSITVADGVFDYGFASVEPDGSSLRDLYTSRSSEGDPFFSDDGKRIVYVAEHGGIETMAADGSDRRPVLAAQQSARPGFSKSLRSPRLSPRQTRVAFVKYETDGGFVNESSVVIAKSDGSDQVIAAGPNQETDDGQSFDWLP